jgi:hypothetical protein
VEAAVVAAGGGLDLLEERHEVIPPVGPRSEVGDDDDHGCQALS